MVFNLKHLVKLQEERAKKEAVRMFENENNSQFVKEKNKLDLKVESCKSLKKVWNMS